MIKHKEFYAPEDFVFDSVDECMENYPNQAACVLYDLAYMKEEMAIKLAAISTASIQNTKASTLERIPKDNPYWTVAYGDVCVALDREIKLLKTLKDLQAQADKLVEALDIAMDALADIRKYSLGSKADTCDEAKKEIENIMEGEK